VQTACTGGDKQQISREMQGKQKHTLGLVQKMVGLR